MNRRIIFAGVIVLAAVGGYFVFQNRINQSPPHSPQYFSYIDVEKIQVGDLVGEFEVVKVEPFEPKVDLPREENFKITFKGHAALEGKFLSGEISGPMLEIAKSSTRLPHSDPQWVVNGICIGNSEVKDADVSYGDTVRIVLDEYIAGSYPAGGCVEETVVSITKLQ